MSLFCNMGETGESTLWLSIVVNCGSSQDGEINRQGAIMYYSNVVISYLQANKILAMKLDRAVSGIEQRVSGQVKTIGAGVTRILYYTSCFTDEYQDVCKKQKNEDVRFAKGIYHLLQRKNIVYEMLKIYFEEIFKHKTTEQLEHIKRILMAVNIHIAADSLTKSGFVLATATCVSVGMKLSLDMGAIAGRSAGVAVTVAGMYGVVQRAADSAERLRICYPAFFSILYEQELEMMYFLVAPLFEHADAFKAQWASEAEFANIIERMIR